VNNAVLCRTASVTRNNFLKRSCGNKYLVSKDIIGFMRCKVLRRASKKIEVAWDVELWPLVNSYLFCKGA
jgi:hypothetical protein